ncbi:hypothetical protein B6C97_07450, partial [Gilliamella apis]
GKVNQTWISSWCNSLGYRLPKVKDLTNARNSYCPEGRDCQGAEPRFSGRHYRLIGAGFFSEWGNMNYYRDAKFGSGVKIDFDRFALYWTSDNDGRRFFVVSWYTGFVLYDTTDNNRILPQYGVCVYP